jgi:hypothetical protein
MATKKAAKKASKRTSAAKVGARRGPKPDTLKIEGDWKEAMRRSLQKKKPPEGWPQ